MFGNIFFKIVRGRLHGVLAEQRATNCIVIGKESGLLEDVFSERSLDE